jgi:hypothetical protein
MRASYLSSMRALFFVVMVSILVGCTPSSTAPEANNNADLGLDTVIVNRTSRGSTSSGSDWFDEVDGEAYVIVKVPKHKDSDSEVFKEGRVKFKVPVDVWRSYDRNGILSTEDEFVLIDSVFTDTVYREQADGNYEPVIEEVHRSVRNGRYAIYFDGIINQESFYEHGKQVGSYTWFDKQGRVKTVAELGENGAWASYEYDDTNKSYRYGITTNGDSSYWDYMYSENLKTGKLIPTDSVRCYNQLKDSIWVVKDFDDSVLFGLLYDAGVLVDTIDY